GPGFKISGSHTRKYGLSVCYRDSRTNVLPRADHISSHVETSLKKKSIEYEREKTEFFAAHMEEATINSLVMMQQNVINAPTGSVSNSGTVVGTIAPFLQHIVPVRLPSLVFRKHCNQKYSWASNIYLEKALDLLEPTKLNYGDALSRGHLIVQSSNVAIKSTGDPVLGLYCRRCDDAKGANNLQLARHLSRGVAPCTVDDQCKEPLGSTDTVLIYEPGGPTVNSSLTIFEWERFDGPRRGKRVINFLDGRADAENINGVATLIALRDYIKIFGVSSYETAGGGQLA
ncbi:hypothetical protein JG688_00008951, partial [Phytophthora aleatoria]